MCIRDRGGSHERHHTSDGVQCHRRQSGPHYGGPHLGRRGMVRLRRKNHSHSLEQGRPQQFLCIHHRRRGTPGLGAGKELCEHHPLKIRGYFRIRRHFAFCAAAAGAGPVQRRSYIEPMRKGRGQPLGCPRPEIKGMDPGGNMKNALFDFRRLWGAGLRRCPSMDLSAGVSPPSSGIGRSRFGLGCSLPEAGRWWRWCRW